MFTFSVKKTIQASAVLLKAHGGRMSRLRLLKMLYMGDRILLKSIGCTITNDVVYAMRNGPVLTRTYDLIKGKDPELPLWSRYIHNDGPLYLVLAKEPGVGCLSEFEVDTLNKIASEFREKDDYDVAEYTHQFPEWKKNEPSAGVKRKNISDDDILEALKIQDMKEAILSEDKNRAVVDDILARVSQ